MATTSVQSMTLKDGSCILVEMEEMDDPVWTPCESSSSNLPPGAEEICHHSKSAKAAFDKVQDFADLLRQNLSGLFETVADSMKKSQPDEWGVEVGIGFKGKAHPVPVVLGGEANAAIKVHAKWTKNKGAAGQNG